MHNAMGIGLAAQQIGRALQMFVVDLSESEAEFSYELDGVRPPIDLIMPMTFVNPKVSAIKGAPDDVYEEGCLSFPEIRGDVSRPHAIAVAYQDVHGIEHLLRCDGLFARCIQHENDHINGILFTDRMDKKTRSGLDEAIKALAKKTRDEETPTP